MKIAIIDDERPARSELRYLLSQVLPEAEIFEADGVKTADALMKEHIFQAIFLDINLGEVSGTVLASAIKEHQKKAAIVFVTAYQEYAVKAFELGAVDYILKPYDLDRIKKTLKRLEEQGYFAEEKETEKYEELDKLAVNAGDKIRLIDYRDIIYIEYNQRNSLIHTADNVYIENYTMTALTEKLEKKNAVFLTAFLGSLANKEKFLDAQTGAYPNMSDWEMPPEERQQLDQETTALSKELNEMLNAKNRIAEIEQELSRVAGEKIAVSFNPHLLPVNRGILATIYTRLKKPLTQDEVQSVYEQTWAGAPWVRVLPAGQLPETRSVRGTMFCDMAVTVDGRTGRLIISSAIDNLCRGASGQAVANANLMCGLPVSEGLEFAPLVP